MKCNCGTPWNEDGVCLKERIVGRKKFKVEFEEVVTCEIEVEANSSEEAQALIESGEYDARDITDSDRNLRDIIDVKEVEGE